LVLITLLFLLSDLRYQTEGENYYLSITCVQKTANDTACTSAFMSAAVATGLPVVSALIAAALALCM
jgi:hypothetical protein